MNPFESKTNLIGLPYLSLPGFHQKLMYPPGLNMEHVLKAENNEVVMISFVYFETKFNNGYKENKGDNLRIYEIHNENDTRLVFEKNGIDQISPKMFNTSLKVTFSSSLDIMSIRVYSGFKMYYSFHKSSLAPRRNENQLFDCSTNLYESFKQHLECNFR